MRVRPRPASRAPMTCDVGLRPCRATRRKRPREVAASGVKADFRGVDMNHSTATRCRNGHDLAAVGVYTVKRRRDGGVEQRCRRCHLDSIERSRRKLRAQRKHREELLPNEVRRFKAKIAVQESGCWHWQGATQNHGYGIIQIAGRARLAHRVSYRHFRGSFDDALDIDHLCRNPGCVNPKHLEPVTHAVNTARGLSPSAAPLRALMAAGKVYAARKAGRQAIHL